MYNAEVLSKFPVVQHFPFGSLFSWEQDPNAEPATTSVHTASQPASRSTTLPGAVRPPPQESTKAPWATPPAGGIPSTTAPWAQAPRPSGQSSTRALWADGRGGNLPLGNPRPTAMPPPSQMPDGPTRAPWADQGGTRGR